MKIPKVRKQMTFPTVLVEEAEEKGRRLGLGFNEYIRHLIVHDIISWDNYDIPDVDEATEHRIGEALEDVKYGRYTDVNSKEELHKLLKEK